MSNEHYKNQPRVPAGKTNGGEWTKEGNLGNVQKHQQTNTPIHTFNASYKHTPGSIAGVIKGAPMDHAEADSGNVNPFYKSGIPGYENNCQTCVATYVARRLGYQVRALPNSNNKYIEHLSHATNEAFVDKSTGFPPSYIAHDGYQDLYSWLLSNVKEGGLYAIEYGWRTQPGYGHITMIERNGYQIKAYDPQCDETLEDQDLLDYLWYDAKNIKLMNLTNCKMNEKFCDFIMIKE